MADIFQEVDEDLRQERYAALWKKYGTYVIVAAVVIVLAVGGTVAWRQYQESQRAQAGEAFQAAFLTLQNDQPAEAAAAFGALAESGPAGYATLAGLMRAQALSESGDREGAAAAYRAVAEDDGADPLFRDLARILAAITIVDSAPREDVAAWLEPLDDDASAMRHSARELLALAALKAGDAARATELFTALADDETAPAGVRARATEILAGSDG